MGFPFFFFAGIGILERRCENWWKGRATMLDDIASICCSMFRSNFIFFNQCIAIYTYTLCFLPLS